MRAASCFALLMLCAAARAFAQEDIDFVAEHLPEAAMDNRLLSLPLSYSSNQRQDNWDAQIQASTTRIETGHLTLKGPGVGFGLRRQLGRHWAVLGMAFIDRLSFSGGVESRPVAPIFSATIPLSLPADAILSNLRGDLNQSSAGFAFSYQPESRPYTVSLGAVRQRVRLSNYRVDYLLTSGPDAGTAGTLDYSTDYPFWIPFATFEWRITRAAWQFSPRFSAGLPMPHRGWRGRIEGPGFDVSGDTDTIGRGKHMGDPFAGFGFGVTYAPWHLTMDAGALLNQALLEPRIHPGVDRAWLLNFDWEL